MNYTIILSAKVKKTFDEIFNYIAQDNLEKAEEFTEELLSTMNQLKDFPFLGTQLKVDSPNKRKLVFKNYIIAYQINHTTKTISILHIRHGARKPI